MKISLRFLALAAATLIATTSAVRADAASADSASSPASGTYSFSTELIDARYPHAGAYEGVLNLTLAPDGTVNGIYRSSDSSHIDDVTGGVSGDTVWLNIGFRGLHIDGTFKDGHIDGYTQLWSDGNDYRFEAVSQSKHI